MNDTTRQPDSPLSDEDRRTLQSLVLAVLSMQIITPFLQSGVAVLLPSMGRDFGASATELGLVSTVYCMALAIFNLAMGRAGDKWGRRRVCLASMVILVPTVALVAFAPSMESIIALRFWQGMGTAAFSTSSLAMLVACSPPTIRGRLLGLTGTGVHLGLSVGPVLGGYLNTLWGWRVFFYAISAWAVLCFAIMALLVRREWYESPESRYDWPGFFLFALGMIVLVQGCVGPGELLLRILPDAAAGLTGLWQGELWRLPCAGLGLLLTALFLVREYRVRDTVPLLDIRVLVHNTMFVLSSLAAFATYAALFSLTFFFSLYLQYVRGMDSGEAGLILFIQPVVQVLCVWPGGWLADRVGAAPVALAGNLLAILGLGMAIFLSATTPIWYMALIMILSGIGMALFVTPNTVMIMSSVDKAHMSQASGLVGTCRTAGMLLSMVIATSFLRLCTGTGTLGADNVPGIVDAMRYSFMVFTALCLTSFACSIVRVRTMSLRSPS